MFTTAVIAFREFLEAFLIVGVFLGISKTLRLRRELEIILAAAAGIASSLVLAVCVYALGDHARLIFTEQNADLLESYLLIFSGAFIAYVAFSLHDTVRKSRGGSLLMAHKKLQQRVFDASLFFTIVFIVLREGFEVVLFTASVALFSGFMQNVAGVLAGFAAAMILGLSVSVAYIRFPFGRIFRVTEYMIIYLGAVLTQRGVTLLLDTQFHVRMSRMVPLPLAFLPADGTFAGHLIQGLFGIDRQFSVGRLGIMLVYMGAVYIIFFRRRLRRIAREVV